MKSAKQQVYSQAGIFGATGLFLGYGGASRVPALSRFRIPVAAFGGVMFGLMQASATSTRLFQKFVFLHDSPLAAECRNIMRKLDPGNPFTGEYDDEDAKLLGANKMPSSDATRGKRASKLGDDFRGKPQMPQLAEQTFHGATVKAM